MSSDKIKTVFLQDEYITQHGIMILSEILKEGSFDTDVFITEVEKGDFLGTY